MKIDFNKPFKDTDGNIIEKAGSLGKALGKFLVTANKGIETYKAYEWNKHYLSKDEPLELDTTDYEALQNFVMKRAVENEQVFAMQGMIFSNLFAGQILEIMKEAKENSEKK